MDNLPKIPIIFMVSVPKKHGLDSGLSQDWLYSRYDYIDENHNMSNGERQAWVITGNATTDLSYYDKQGIVYEDGKKYFNGVHVWKRDNPNEVGARHFISYLPDGQLQTANTWVESEWYEL